MWHVTRIERQRKKRECVLVGLRRGARKVGYRGQGPKQLCGVPFQKSTFDGVVNANLPMTGRLFWDELARLEPHTL